MGDSGAFQYPCIQIVDGDGKPTKYFPEYMDFINGRINDHKSTQLAIVATPAFTPRSEAKCFAYTGKFCASEPCSESSGAVCQAGRCVCKAGCAGLDGVCYQQEYTRVLSHISLRNAMWPTYYMYMKRSSDSQLALTNARLFVSYWELFNLYALPGRENRYLLGSTLWPQHIATMKESQGFTFLGEPAGLYAQDISDGKELSLEDMSVTVCSVGSKIMIGGGTPIAWAIAKRGSWDVYGYQSKDLDVEGQWIVDPPLVQGEVPAC